MPREVVTYFRLNLFHIGWFRELRKKWIVAIRRANLAIKAHTRVCSRHFKREDIQEPESEIGRRRLKKGAVPALFQWNNFSLPLPRPGVWERRKRPLPEDSEEEANPPANVYTKEHDYASAPDPAVVDLVLEENNALREEIRQLRKQMESLSLRQRFDLTGVVCVIQNIKLLYMTFNANKKNYIDIQNHFCTDLYFY
uniref:THAP domain-containing protein 1 n=1 Tax=Poecilia latipinna TaxID=48699 RepID=A0A3B3UUJ4_9TELE